MMHPIECRLERCSVSAVVSYFPIIHFIRVGCLHDDNGSEDRVVVRAVRVMCTPELALEYLAGCAQLPRAISFSCLDSNI